VSIVASDNDYRTQFASAFPSVGVTATSIASALEAYVRSLRPAPSRFDRYWVRGEAGALSAAELRGLELFRGRAKCAECHLIREGHSAFTDNGFHAMSVGMKALVAQLGDAARRSLLSSKSDLDSLIASDKSIAALARFNVTRKLSDVGKYRTPSLRNVAVTAPYMHDGSIATLEAAVETEIYYRGRQQDRALIVTAQERRDLTAFLRSLTSESTELRPGHQ
jgi:cytochrome c peroxidase